MNSSLDKYLSYLSGRSVVRLVTVQLGVWDVTYRETSQPLLPGFPSKDDIKGLSELVPPLRTFLKEIYRIAPKQLAMHIVDMAWSSLDSGLSLYASGFLMNAIISRLQGSDRSGAVIYRAVTLHLVLAAMKGLMRKISDKEDQILRSRISFHFKAKAMHSALSSLEKSADSNNIPTRSFFRNPFGGQTDGFDAYTSFNDLMGIIKTISSGLLQVYFGVSLVRNYPFDPWFLLICISEPLIQIAKPGRIFSLEYVSYCTNAAYRRLTALNDLAFNKNFWTDIQSDGVGEYIEREYNQCRKEVGDKSTDNALLQMRSQSSLPQSIGLSVVNKLPTLYFAFKAIVVPGSLSLGTFTVLQQASQQISWTLYFMTREIPNTLNVLRNIKNAYKDSAPEPKLKDGQVDYPSGSLVASDLGMDIEFRNVSFAYPGTTKNAISNVSFSIKPGQLVAIVGVNGSGKSTITNLFNRLYDPTEGEVLVDGRPLPSYKVGDVRRCMAVLRQSHPVYPLSLRENIALGAPDFAPTEAELNAALEDGGAYNFVQKLPGKLDTVLSPVKLINGNLRANDVPELKDIFNQEVTTDVSGGEGQRLAASRTFMRLRRGQIRFFAADEPTSALDPEGEHELFTRLMQRRKGMTVVFITHRFGHVTKHADLILCLKDGELIEQGSHSELIAMGGEYRRLYNIQADAFSQPEDTGNPVTETSKSQEELLQDLQSRLLRGDFSGLSA